MFNVKDRLSAVLHSCIMNHLFPVLIDLLVEMVEMSEALK